VVESKKYANFIEEFEENRYDKNTNPEGQVIDIKRPKKKDN